MITTHTPGPWKIEPHGNTTALYSGRDKMHHGLRLMNLDDGDQNFAANAKRIIDCVNALEGIEDPKAWVEKAKRALNQ